MDSEVLTSKIILLSQKPSGVETEMLCTDLLGSLHFSGNVALVFYSFKEKQNMQEYA